jgi:hypothetical protein
MTVQERHVVVCFGPIDPAGDPHVLLFVLGGRAREPAQRPYGQRSTARHLTSWLQAQRLAGVAGRFA